MGLSQATDENIAHEAKDDYQGIYLLLYAPLLQFNIY